MIWPDDYINKIICGDCLEVMKGIPDGAVDLVFVDVPYNCGKDYGETYNDNLPIDEYIAWLNRMVLTVKKVSIASAWYVPKKYDRELWNMLGDDFQRIVMPVSQAGAIRYGFSNQFQSILTNARPLKKSTPNVWNNCQMPSMGYFFKEDTCGHPGYTSVDICSRVVNYLSLINGICIDPCNGSGSFSLAAKQLGRKYIGIEINPDYCKIAEDRLRQEELF